MEPVGRLHRHSLHNWYCAWRNWRREDSHKSNNHSSDEGSSDRQRFVLLGNCFWFWKLPTVLWGFRLMLRCMHFWALKKSLNCLKIKYFSQFASHPETAAKFTICSPTTMKSRCYIHARWHRSRPQCDPAHVHVAIFMLLRRSECE